MKGIIQPDARRRSAKKKIVAGKDAPNSPRILHLRLADFKIVKWDSLTQKHPVDVMIRLNKQLGWIRKSFVLREPGGLRVTMRTDDGQIFDARIESPRNGSRRRVSRKQSVFMDQHFFHVSPSGKYPL